MHKYRNKKLPISFSHIFTDALDAGGTHYNRHSDYNYDTVPATKKYLEKFPLKQIIFNWNSLNLELKATADPLEFETMLKSYYLSKYKSELDCPMIVIYALHNQPIYIIKPAQVNPSFPYPN